MPSYRQLIPFFDTTTLNWAVEARLLRWLTFLWLGVGLVLMFSASYPVALEERGDGFYYIGRQLLWMVIGMVGFNIMVHTPMGTIIRASHGICFLLMLMLLATLLPGVGITAQGSARWLALGSFPLQPSELLKPFLVIQGACVFARWSELSVLTRLNWCGIFCLVLGVILLQPNLSTTAVCGITIWLMAMAAGLPLKHLLITAGTGIGLGILSISLRSYQQDRLCFLNPWSDPVNRCYQLVQSLIAVGSGQLFGKGFGLSQQKLFYLPIADTDFIFAVFAEEFGFFGCLLLLTMLLFYSTLALRVAIQAQRPVYRLIAIGSIILLIGQSLTHIGVVIGVLPTTGLPFPLISYGGSSLIANLTTAGLLIRVARENREAVVIPFTSGGRSPTVSSLD